MESPPPVEAAQIKTIFWDVDGVLADNPEYAQTKQMMRQELPTHHEPDGVTYTPVGYKWGLPTKSKK